MVMPRMVKVSDFDPSILGDIIGLALLRSFIGVLRTYCVNVVLGLEIKLSMKMS